MKVLQIINSLGTGGAEKLLLETLPVYKEKGIIVDLLVLNGTNYPFMEELKALNCCKIYSLGSHSVYNPVNIFKLIRYLDEYDIAHVHLFPAQYWVVLAKIISFSKIKLFFTEHSTSNRRMELPLISILDRVFYSSYRKIIAISEGVNDSVIRHLRSDDKNIVILNGINLTKVNLATKNLTKDSLFHHDNNKLLIQVGGFRIQKDQDTTIRSLQYLPSNFHLLLVGVGEREKQLKKLVIQLKLEDRVHFMGVRKDVFSILKNIDVVIVSSHQEGFGLAAVEGMAAKKPVIASDVPGLSEVVKGAGVLFELGNAKELAERIQELLGDESLYNRIAQACQLRAAQYNIENMIQKHIELYQEVYAAI